MTHTNNDELVVLAELTLKPDMRDAFLDYAVENLAASRAADGNIGFDILRDETRPDRVIFHEVWASAEAQQAYMAWRVQRGDLTILLSFLACHPKFTTLRCVAD